MNTPPFPLAKGHSYLAELARRREARGAYEDWLFEVRWEAIWDGIVSEWEKGKA